MSSGRDSTDALEKKLRQLHDFSACDVSDALLKLQKPQAGQVPRAGYLADIRQEPYAVPKHDGQPSQKVIAPASTLKLIHKLSPALESTPPPENQIPKGSHWADLTEPGTIVVIDQPEGQCCAAVGGIMAQRMKVRGAAGCVVGGRVRDQAELLDSGLPIYARGRSTVGTNAEAAVYARNVTVSITGVPVSPGDVVFLDPDEGVVVIPQDLLDDTLSLMPKLVAADEKVKEAVMDGMTVAAAFKQFRG